MIRVECPACAVVLKCKPELAGQTRKCPKCGGPVTIPQPEPVAEPIGEPTEPGPPAVVGHVAEQPRERLNRQHRYLVCERTRLIAMWDNNGQGWMVKTNTGLAPVARNQDKLPVEGDFRLVELKLEPTPEGHRLVGLASYQLARRWALRSLTRGDDAILKAVVAPAGLNREQKIVVRQALHEHFMGPVWQGAQNVLDYLKSTDYHTPSVG